MSDSLKRSHSCGLLTKEAAGEQVVLCGLGCQTPRSRRVDFRRSARSQRYRSNCLLTLTMQAICFTTS